MKTDYICDDRLDMSVLADKISKMTDEEFEEHLKKIKEKEQKEKK